MQHHQIRGSRTAQELMRDNMIVKHMAGSHAYGTALPTSDVDMRGVFSADPINIRTPWFTVKETEVTDEEDTKLYELTHFMKLCLECNPNIIETLWVDESDILHGSAVYDNLRAARERLLSKKLAFTFSGYALAQLKRIKGHNKWINNPMPVDPPKPYQYLSLVQWFGPEKMLKLDLGRFRDGHRLVPYGSDTYGVYPWIGYQLYDDHGNLNAKFEQSREDLGVPIMILRWNKEDYNVAKQRHEQYWSWKTNRNIARGVLEQEFGYDTKHAMHLVRLLRMGEEAMSTGQIIVKRPDAEELLAIRSGAWTYEEIVDYATEMDIRVRETLYRTSDLPKKPDIKFAANLLMDLQDMVWSSVKS